jgi:hypothetical protein
MARIKNEFCATGQKMEAWPSPRGFVACLAWRRPSTVVWLAVAQDHWAGPAGAARARTGVPGSSGSCAARRHGAGSKASSLKIWRAHPSHELL